MSNYDQNNINNDQELINYLDTDNMIPNNNTTVELENNIYPPNINKHQNNNTNKKEEIYDMELNNIQMLILHRSLYILKRKFEINKKELEIIYQKYKDEDYMKLKCINVDYLLELYKEIMDLTQFTMLPYTNFNELISADLMTELNEGKTKVILKALVKFTKDNVEKYNRIYFDKKMKKRRLIEENEKKKKADSPPPDMEDYTTKQKIVKINKRGKIIRTFEEMLENNKEFEVGEDVIVKLNEDDMSILNNKKLLYSDVIPLIIADFIQEYLKNNEHVAIVSTSNVSEDQENFKLNQNVKSLFDKDILKFYNNLNKVDPNEENKEKLKNLLYELMNIENQIKIYQKLILEKTSKGANVKHLMNMEKKLSEQKAILEKKISYFNSISKYSNSKQGLSSNKNGGDISRINNTNSNFDNNSTLLLTEKNKLFKKNNSNSKINKGNKNIKYKIGTNASNKSLNSKKVLKTINNNNYNSNYILSNNNANTIGNVNDIYRTNTTGNYANSNNSNFINGSNSSNINDINNPNNNNNSYNSLNLNIDNNSNDNKFNYYYNNDNFYYQHGVKYPETKEEFRKNSLLEIFYFYTKQHSLIGQTPTFQEILKSEEHLDMAEFSKFCVEFKILVKPKKIAEIFKKTSTNSKELNYALFIKTLQKLSVCANEEKKEYLMKKIKFYKTKLKEVKEKNKGKEDIKVNENKEENLSGIKSEGEAEDEEKCQQEKNFENQNLKEENKEINNEIPDVNNLENNNEKKNNEKEKESDKKSNNKDDKKSHKSSYKNDDKISENLINNNEIPIEKENENQNENEQNINNENQEKNSEQKNNDKEKNNRISTNLKYYRQYKSTISNPKKNKNQSKKLKLVKPKTNSFLLMETKEEIEEKISKLQEDYDKLNQKTSTQLEEEFYQYLEIDDINSYRKKMVGYIYPFIKRDNLSRFPLQSVSHPFKKDPKMQKEMHKILIQRHEEMKREKELKQQKEKNILFEKRKKKFEIDNKKIQQKMNLKNDYLQIKRNAEDYQKEKMNKITWQQIQKLDYDTFIINEADKRDKYRNNLEDIFKSNQLDGDDDDYLKNFRLKKGFNETGNDEKNGNKNNKINNNVNSLSNNLSTNFENNNNMIENINKTEPLAPKFDTNLSRISSGNNNGNNSEFEIANSIESNK